MKAFLLAIGVAVTAAALASCSSSTVAALTETGVRATGGEPEKARAVGQSAGQFAGSFAPLPWETEYAIGGGIALKSFSEQGQLHPSDQLQEYVTKVGLAIVAKTPRAGFPFAFAVVDRDDVNAWAAPGDYVFITAGAIRAMEDESELAGVLAHEIAHVTRGHMVRMMQNTQRFAAIAQGVQAGLEKDIPQLTQTVDLGHTIIFERGLDKDMELEADTLGVEYAAATGYDPQGLYRFLTRLEQRSTGKGGGWLTSTHPPLNTRIAGIRAKISNDLVGIDGAVAKERFQAMTAKALAQ